VDGDCRAGGGVLGVVGPGVGGGFVGDLGSIQRDGRVAGAVEAFRALQANPEAPGRVVAEG
jgi:hypothetical protein